MRHPVKRLVGSLFLIETGIFLFTNYLQVTWFVLVSNFILFTLAMMEECLYSRGVQHTPRGEGAPPPTQGIHRTLSSREWKEEELRQGEAPTGTMVQVASYPTTNGQRATYVLVREEVRWRRILLYHRPDEELSHALARE